MTINKIIRECSSRNFSKATKLFESELEKKVYEILNNEKEEMLDLKEFDTDEEEKVCEAECSDEEMKAESDENCEDPMTEEDTAQQEKFKALLADYGVESPNDLSDDEKAEFFSKLKESEDQEMKEESEEVFDSTLEGGDHLEEDEEKETELDFVTEDDFEKIAEKVLFGKRRK